ncbi:MAG TPA: aspartate--ammonia ligase [Clostridia bacterium]|nr:aspartate--ammonia ligase [Clostridia bacterium]
MYKLKIPTNYISRMDIRETQRALKFVKDNFQRNLIREFGFERVSAPLFVKSRTGINDDLNGIERAVQFDIKEQDNVLAEIVHSLAKWKRIALKEYGFSVGEGLYTDMNAIRRDDSCDNIHSIYVDQWDWEMVISKEQRTVEFLKSIVQRLISAIVDALEDAQVVFPKLNLKLTKKVHFITAQELFDIYPTLSSKERENEITKKYGTVFLMNIGGKLSNGEKHDGRAPDYDDWNLNGDILFWNDVLQESIELSSMGIRVDAEALKRQLVESECEERLSHPYHKAIVTGELPLTIGGGIGQSRLCMFLLQKAHIGEVQVSIWPDEMRQKCAQKGIKLL